MNQVSSRLLFTFRCTYAEASAVEEHHQGTAVLGRLRGLVKFGPQQGPIVCWILNFSGFDSWGGRSQGFHEGLVSFSDEGFEVVEVVIVCRGQIGLFEKLEANG